MVTTSHRPSPRTRAFVKDLVSVLPTSYKVNRGHKTLLELAIEAKRRKLNYIAVVTERGGNPSSIIIYEISEGQSLHPSLTKIATLVLKGVKLSRENPSASRAYGIDKIGVDFSNCISDDCFYLADVLLKVFNKMLGEKPDIVVVLEEDRVIVLKFTNIYKKPVGPIIRILRVLHGGKS